MAKAFIGIAALLLGAANAAAAASMKPTSTSSAALPGATDYVVFVQPYKSKNCTGGDTSNTVLFYTDGVTAKADCRNLVKPAQSFMVGYPGNYTYDTPVNNNPIPPHCAVFGLPELDCGGNLLLVADDGYPRDTCQFNPFDNKANNFVTIKSFQFECNYDGAEPGR